MPAGTGAELGEAAAEPAVNEGENKGTDSAGEGQEQSGEEQGQAEGAAEVPSLASDEQTDVSHEVAEQDAAVLGTEATSEEEAAAATPGMGLFGTPAVPPIPVSTIAFDAQGQSRRFLKDLARITNGTSKSVKSKMFT